jgi:hypothetical protein
MSTYDCEKKFLSLRIPVPADSKILESREKCECCYSLDFKEQPERIS